LILNALNKIIENKIFVFLFVVSGIFLAGLIYVLTVAFGTSVEMSNDYQMSYKELEKNYDQIIKSEKLFDQKYKVTLLNGRNLGQAGNTVALRIEDAAGNIVKEANVTAVVTRPDTTKHDIILPAFRFENGQHLSIPFDLSKIGRWQISYCIEMADATKHIQVEYIRQKSEK
jgi:FixH